jgi:hypothetical protein
MLAANSPEEIYMADKVKVTKAGKKPTATPKPRKTATKKATVAAVGMVAAPTRVEIEKLARKFWAERGWQDGYAEQDWLRAEQELRKMAS